ncbi:hypothetical protein VTN96DRAFT_4876 [Rasamsonia emersonii]
MASSSSSQITKYPDDKSLSSTTSSSSSSSLNCKKPTRLSDLTFRNQNIFDPWNSASTGHQRAENPYSCTTEWRQTRTEKLARQFRGVPSDDCSDATNSRGKTTGEWRWLSAEEAKRKELGCEDIRKFFGGVKKGQTEISISVSKKAGLLPTMGSSSRQKLTFCENNNNDSDNNNNNDDNDNDNKTNAVDDNIPGHKEEEEKKSEPEPEPQPGQGQEPGQRRGIFTGLTFYINGSTFPLISDHKLKHLLVENGGNISLALGRQSVTHVILGRPNNHNTDNNNSNNCSGYNYPGAGGGLSAGKLQKEISRAGGGGGGGGGKGVKFVGVEWVLESLKASKRLPEARFSSMHMAARKQPSVYGMFAREKDISKQKG